MAETNSLLNWDNNTQTETIKGYKVFNYDWTCKLEGKRYKYSCPGIFEEGASLSVGDRGLHFCKQAIDCFNYYIFNPDNKVAEVIALGKVEEKGDTCCTNKIQIVREISWYELLTIVNTGKNCTGLGNSGNNNSGHNNTGNNNSGCRNSGDNNRGHGNSSNSNIGDKNSGYNNIGNYNSGIDNKGNSNSGNCNKGNHNSGDFNIGDRNVGDWNKSSLSIGCFNTEVQRMKFFDKETNMTFEEWRDSEARYLLNSIAPHAIKLVSSEYMTEKEKLENPGHEVTGVYLKEIDNSKRYIEWWNNLSYKNREIIQNIPNFDADKFYEITGIQVYDPYLPPQKP